MSTETSTLFAERFTTSTGTKILALDVVSGVALSMNTKFQKFAVVRKGGSIGGTISQDLHKGLSSVKVFDTVEEAKACAKRFRKMLTPGERKYYRMTYATVKL